MQMAGSPADQAEDDRGFRSAEGARKVPLRHPWWWVGGVVLILIIGMFAQLLVTNKNMKWSTVLEYLFDGEILSGLVTTLELTVLAMVIGLALGMLTRS